MAHSIATRGNLNQDFTVQKRVKQITFYLHGLQNVKFYSVC